MFLWVFAQLARGLGQSKARGMSGWAGGVLGRSLRCTGSGLQRGPLVKLRSAQAPVAQRLCARWTRHRLQAPETAPTGHALCRPTLLAPLPSRGPGAQGHSICCGGDVPFCTAARCPQVPEPTTMEAGGGPGGGFEAGVARHQHRTLSLTSGQWWGK